MTKAQFPKITIVTPSYNQGQFIEDTIQSVLDQGYPNLEYIVMDGGSVDNTVEILKKYDDQITHWESAKDNGQSDAINRGFARATGDVIGWLNSDDMYEKGTLHKIAEVFQQGNMEDLKIVFGNCNHFQDGSTNYVGSNVQHCHEKFDIRLCDYIIQPSSFWTRKTFETVGPLNETQIYTFDWEWFIRAKSNGVEFIPVNDYFSYYRFHDDHKTGTGGGRRKEEIEEIMSRVSNVLSQSHLKMRKRLDLKIIIRLGRLLEQAYEKFGRPPGLKKSNFIHKFVYLLYFRNITWFEFQNIIRM
jgi:glycosyltransferase involved in cell wall biosynthesis